MNERIQSLYKQVCGKEWVHDFDTDKAQLFAELIVKECINIAINYDRPKLHGPGLTIGMYIEAHFDIYVGEDGRFVK